MAEQNAFVRLSGGLQFDGYNLQGDEGKRRGKKIQLKIWKMSFTVVSAMGKMSVVYPLWNLVFYSVYSCKQIE